MYCLLISFHILLFLHYEKTNRTTHSTLLMSFSAPSWHCFLHALHESLPSALPLKSVEVRQALQYLTLFLPILKNYLKALAFLIQQHLFILICLLLDSTHSLGHTSTGMRFSCIYFSVPVLFIYPFSFTCVQLAFPQNVLC